MNQEATIVGALVASLLLAGVAVAAPSSHSIDWWILGGGHGSGTAAGITVDGTVGQTVVGVDGSGDYVICTGFWYGLGPCGGPSGFSVFLPVVLRGSP